MAQILMDRGSGQVSVDGGTGPLPGQLPGQLPGPAMHADSGRRNTVLRAAVSHAAGPLAAMRHSTGPHASGATRSSANCPPMPALSGRSTGDLLPARHARLGGLRPIGQAVDRLLEAYGLADSTLADTLVAEP